MKKLIYTANEVANILAEEYGDDCACDFNGNDEWLPEVCEYADECPYPSDNNGCWKQYLKYKDQKQRIIEENFNG